MDEFNGMSKSEPPATLQGAATWRIQCHDPRATCHIAGCCYWANSTACHPRATYHIAGCCHLGKFTVMIPEPHATLQDGVTYRAGYVSADGFEVNKKWPFLMVRCTSPDSIGKPYDVASSEYGECESYLHVMLCFKLLRYGYGVGC